jgi:peptide/nickel transport system substrate-binding protein
MVHHQIRLERGKLVLADSGLLTRRRFVSVGLAAVGGLALGGNAFAAPSARTLRVGSLGNAKDTVDCHYSVSNMDLQRVFQLYDTLTYFDHQDFTLRYGLAESIELNKTATVATIRLRNGVTFHNGKALTADDLIFSFRRILDPMKPGRAAKSLGSINAKALTKLDQRTVSMGLNYPDAIIAERFYIPQTSIVPVGFDPQQPVGTGPFMFQSFVPGQRSVFVRNPHYWVNGQPHLDQVVIIDFPDSTSQVNALLAGQVDAVDALPQAQIPVVRGRPNLRLLIAKAGYYQPIVMRVDLAPFNDVRVRQAFRLIANRNQAVQQAYSGYGTIGNDMPCPHDPAYPRSLPQRVQDLDQAKSLLKAAGQSTMSINLVTADEDSGLVAGAQVFAENAKGAGITVNVEIVQGAEYDVKFTQWPFTQGYYGDKPFGIMFALRNIPGGIFNDAHWSDPTSIALYRDALKETSPATRNEKFTAIEKILYDSGGDIITSYRDTIDAYSANLTGFTPDAATGWSLGQYRYREVSSR